MNPVVTERLAALLLILPVSGALLCLLVPVRMRVVLGLCFSVLTTIAAVALALAVIETGGVRYALGGWEAPLAIHLNVDGLACVFLLLTALVGLPISFYAGAFYRSEQPGSNAREHFWPLWLFLWMTLNGLYLSADLFNLYVLLEVLGLAAVSLAILSGKPPALVAGLRYLLVALVGSMAYLLGVALLYGAYGNLDLKILGDTLEVGVTTQVAIGLMVIGLMIKTALFPFHFWLPSAHSAAEAPVSALLSALVIKASFYLILRLWVDVFGGSITYASGQAIGVLGAIAVVWGSYQALRQERLKLMVAHSTVGQIGYMFLLFPLITVMYDSIGDADWIAHAWTGGIYQALAHGFAKAAMFLSVGIFVMAVGNDRKASMVNMVGRLPMTTFAFALAGVSLIGLPPSGGFVAKWMLLKASFASGQWWWAPMIVWGSFLTAGYVFMVLRQAFAPTTAETPELRPVPRIMEIAALLLGIGAIVIGFRAEEVLLLLDIAAPFAESVEVVEGGGSQ